MDSFIMIIPVLDIKDNKCVSGKSGNRKSYIELKSVYGKNPLQIASNLKKDGYKYLYVADLDRIEKISDNDELISKINDIIPVILDNGISNKSDMMYNKNIASFSIIATETVNSLDDLIEMITFSAEDTIVSLDIVDERLLIANENITIDDVINIINTYNVRYLIVLNISNVGTKKSGNSSIEEYIIKNTPDSTHIIAGGLTNSSISKYNDEGISNFLVGTILHQGLLDL